MVLPHDESWDDVWPKQDKWNLLGNWAFWTKSEIGQKLGMICCCSVTKSYLSLCDPMDCSTPGFHVLHYLLELAQTRVHRVSDAIQTSHPLSSPSLPAFNLSQHQGLSQWLGITYKSMRSALHKKSGNFQGEVSPQAELEIIIKSHHPVVISLAAC